ncbi:flagellar biosynthesis protein FlhF [Metabacillus halosaccharovorans]|uniref:flagellar biosynthesis protein FlhF n=1 Tax=Metabacillus halosaccharovorans TaxID=930124 RepID=UPI001C1F9BD0|nr:flagellar biosynthesis protein FlhF [Metabacillus halosaccharovorans]MBU7592134.1 flagellar biosynthesis protein FlhF [Metabacillus halosaccharovorans]
MKVKKYVATSMQEAMKKIRSEMGNDAVILNSKMIQTGGFLGFFTKKKIEVIAAMDPDVSPIETKTVKNVRKEAAMPPIKDSGLDIAQQVQTNSQKNIDQLQLLDELSDMKRLLKSVSTNEKIDMYPQPLKKMLENMIEQEISPVLRSQLMAELLDFWYVRKGDISGKELLAKQHEFFAHHLADLDFGGISYKKKYINVIGPTGVGKTTTLAKLAAECVLQRKKKVAFITTDTYRIAAIDQLKTYAKILDVPIEICYTTEDFKQAKQKLAMYDYVFIDTAGRNFLELKYVSDLQKIINFDDEMETFLVLAATAKPTDMLAVFKQFSVIPIHKLIFTKLDETSTKGSLFDVMINTKKGIAYTTHGQNVPDDIEVATRDRIVEQMLR